MVRAVNYSRAFSNILCHSCSLTILPFSRPDTLVSELLKDPVPTALKQVYITKKTGLPQIQLTQPIEIHQLVPIKRAPCVFCRWSRQNKRGVSQRIITKSNCVPKTQFSCSHCSTPLCRPCFWLFHYSIA
jgi:hypothetical protein